MAPRAGDDEFRATRRFRWAGELRKVFAGDRMRDRDTGSLLPCPLRSAAGPIPDAVANIRTQNSRAHTSWLASGECVLVVMSIASSPLPYSSSSSSSSSSWSSWSDLAGDEKRFSMGSMPCSSRTPESGTVRPVFLGAHRQYTRRILSGRGRIGANVPPYNAELVDVFAHHGATRHGLSGRHVGGVGCCCARVVRNATSQGREAIRKVARATSSSGRPGVGDIKTERQASLLFTCARGRGKSDKRAGCGSRRACVAHAHIAAALDFARHCVNGCPNAHL